MDKDRVDVLESELVTLRQMVDTQTTTLSTIQQQLSLLVNLTVHNPPQPTTATPSQTVDLPLEQPLPLRPAAQPTRGRTSLKPAAPSEFDGSCHKGQAFLNSCELYMNLALQQFTNETSKVHWALSYMKAGRASLYADRVLRYKAKNGVPRYLSWFAFWEDFVKTFCPKSEAQRALTWLETAEYHQGRRTVDEYTDEFRDLIELAGYTDGLAIVIKFCRGLSREIQDQVATMPVGRPADDKPEGWYEAMALCDENRITNAAFFSAKPVPTRHTTSVFRAPQMFSATAPRATPMPLLPPPVPSFPAPVPMDVDAVRRRTAHPQTCYRCGQSGHLRRDCTLRHDTRYMTLDEKEDLIQQLMADINAAAAQQPEQGSRAAEGSAEEDFVPCSR
jgi:hypothetical protein